MIARVDVVVVVRWVHEGGELTIFNARCWWYWCQQSSFLVRIPGYYSTLPKYVKFRINVTMLHNSGRDRINHLVAITTAAVMVIVQGGIRIRGPAGHVVRFRPRPKIVFRNVDTVSSSFFSLFYSRRCVKLRGGLYVM